VLGKQGFWGHVHTVTMKIGNRITPNDKTFGDNYAERAKLIRRHYQETLPTFYAEVEDVSYARKLLIDNYRYRGFKMVWNLKRTLRKEHDFEYLNQAVPTDAKVAIVGAGYGYSAYMLSLLSKQRTITGFEHEEELRQLANNCLYKNNKIAFEPFEKVADLMGTFDVLILENVSLESIAQVLPLLADGGKLIVTGGNYKALKAVNKAALFVGFEKKVIEPVAGYEILIGNKKAQ
jgi:hypothetical protein